MNRIQKLIIFSGILGSAILLLVVVSSTAFGRVSYDKVLTSAVQSAKRAVSEYRADSIAAFPEKEKIQEKTLLQKLAKDETRILDEVKPWTRHETVIEVSQVAKEVPQVQEKTEISRRDVPEIHTRLINTSKTNKILENQQESFVSEILKLKRRIRVLEREKTQQVPSFGNETREKELKAEIANEHRQVEKLTRELKMLRAEQIAEVRADRRDNAIQGELIAERMRAEQLERKLAEAKESLRIARREVRESRGTHGKLLETRRAAEQLELQLQAKSSVQTDNEFLRSNLKGIEKEKAQMGEEISALKRQLSKTIEDARVCHLGVDEKEQILSKMPQLVETVKKQKAELSVKDQTIAKLSRELDQHREIASVVPELKKDLIAANHELMLKETEVKLFGKTIKGKKSRSARLSKSSVSPVSSSRARLSAEIPSQKSNLADVMILEVVGKKVNLRSGAGQEHSALMQVSKGNRLTVEAKQGDWYRVFTPTGSRAYIRADMARIIDSGSGVSGANTTSARAAHSPKKPVRRTQQSSLVPFGNVKVAGRASDLETAAFEKLRAISQQKGAVR